MYESIESHNDCPSKQIISSCNIGLSSFVSGRHHQKVMMAGNGQLSVPPGFRFHPTDEELVYYYLKKKVSYEAIELDVIKEVDLNKLEPWDLKDKCRIGSGPQNEWYFFSHKDKKYPTGTRTNRATTAGFWKATGRDKAIHLSNTKRIGMRKTLVFYTGRAPHGQKTDWIMHEYRLDDDDDQASHIHLQEDGWVVCRVFKKKNQNRGFLAEESSNYSCMAKGNASSSSSILDMEPNKQTHLHSLYHDYNHSNNNNYSSFDGSMHLPQLFSPESSLIPPPISFNNTDIECSHNLLRLTSSASATGCGFLQPERSNGDWSFLDKLLASHQTSIDLSHCKSSHLPHHLPHKFPFPNFPSRN